MSEYQHVMFRAVDAPLTDKQLAFAEKQSSRADVTRWSLAVDYHYSSFRGDVDGLLRRGYDVYLQYANYGCREIRIRLPHGLPATKSVWSQYIDGEQVCWKKDAKGKAGILKLFPFHEPGELEEVWEFEKYIDSAIFLRERLMAGDLRPLYMFWVCGAADDYNDPAEVCEPPVPHGIEEMAKLASEFMEFYDLDPLLLEVAGEDLPPPPSSTSSESNLSQWLSGLDGKRAKELLREFLGSDTLGLKTKLLAEIRSSERSEAWPTTEKNRSFAELLSRAEELRSKENAKAARRAETKKKREAEKAERERQQRMSEMQKAPKKWLKEAEQLVEIRGTDNYEAAADILADLREAVGGDKGEKMVRHHAAHLAKQHPTLNRLKSSFRKRGLLE